MDGLGGRGKGVKVNTNYVNWQEVYFFFFGEGEWNAKAINAPSGPSSRSIVTVDSIVYVILM